MKNKVVSAILIVMTCFSLTGCGKSNTENIANNLNYINSIATDGFTTTISAKNKDLKINLKLSGVENQKGLFSKVEYSENAKDYKALTNLYVTNEGLYSDTGTGNLQNFISAVLGTTATLPQDSTIFFGPDNKYIKIQNFNPKIMRNYINKGLIEALKTQDKNTLTKNKNTIQFTIKGDPLKNTMLIVSTYMKTNAENIFNDYYKISDANTKKLMDVSKENAIKQIQTLADLAIKNINSTDFSKLTLTYSNVLDKKVFQELLKIENMDGDFISIQNTINDAGTTQVKVPKDTISVNDIDLMGTDKNSDKDSAQMDEFYQTKYPEADRIKKIIKTQNYTNPQLSTSIKEVTIYAIRDSRSIDMKNNISDEISVVVNDDYLSKVTITNSFSLTDYNLYGDVLIENAKKEMSEIIGTTFGVETKNEFGKYENITTKWGFTIEP